METAASIFRLLCFLGVSILAVLAGLNAEWDQGAYWLLLLLGVTIESRLDRINDTLRETQRRT